jgi:hypothetical protein
MHLVRESLLWLDAVPYRFWLAAGLAFGLSVYLAWLPFRCRDAGSVRGSLLFGFSAMLTIAAFRWPTWFFPLPLNPDEAQIVSGAITLNRFPIYWKHVDGTTHGPLCEYLLLLATWLGAPLGYATARIMAALLQVGSLLAVWRTLRLYAPEHVARMSVLPGLAFWSFVSWDDFLHYSSELPGIFLLTLGTCLAAKVLVSKAVGFRLQLTAGLAGFCLGIVPFGKLQSGPQAAVTALLAVILIWRVRPDRLLRIRLITWLTLGCATGSLIVLLFLGIYRLWNQFWTTYIQSAVAFLDTGAHSFAAMPGRFFHFSATSPAFAWFFWGSLGFSVLHLRGPKKPVPLKTGVIISWLLVAAAYFSILRSGRESAHYLHLLVIPLTMLAGFTLARGMESQTSDPIQPASGSNRPLFLSFIVLTLGLQLFDRVVTSHGFVGTARENSSRPKSDAARYILERAHPDDTVAMWGWEPHLLVEIHLPHGTREAQSGNQLMQWPLTRFFVDRYLFDMRRWQPAWFVDVVGPGAFIFDNRASSGHETIPELAALITSRYSLVAEFDSMRIYRLKSPQPE